jgi:hypothetical protein
VFCSGYDDALVDTICNNLFDYNRDVYADDKFESSGNLIYNPPPLEKSGWMNQKEGTNANVFSVRGTSLKRGSDPNGFVFQFLHLHQSPLVLMWVQSHLSLFYQIQMAMTLMMNHSLHHIKREKSMRQMEFLVVTLVVILVMFLILVILLVWMSMILLNMPVQDIQEKIRRRNNLSSSILRIDATMSLYAQRIKTCQLEPISVQLLGRGRSTTSDSRNEWKNLIAC